MAKKGKGTKYALKYVTVTQEEMRKQVLPRVAEFCAIQRAEQLWTAAQYRDCLKRNLKAAIKGEALS